MVEIDRGQDLLKQGEWPAGSDVVLAKTIEGDPPHLHLFHQLSGRVDTVVPQVGQGVGRTRWSRIVVGDEEKIPVEPIPYDPLEKCLFIDSFWGLRMGVADGVDVPDTRTRVVGLTEIQLTRLVDDDKGRGVVHDRRPAIGAGGEVVGQTESVTDLVGRQLPNASQGQLDRVIEFTAAGLPGPRQTLEEQTVLTHTQRAQPDVALDHLPRSWIDHTATVGPASGRAMHPLDDVVADVQQIHIDR